ncbi:hypothetical protein IJG11_02635 [Candidatus Saccharibacteria bacterium]|nr:hypothetical protein [Candidatus Saccharibacteria bacterium]
MVKYISRNTARTFKISRGGETMHQNASVKLSSGSQPFRVYLRENGFRTYRINLTGISQDDDIDDQGDVPHYYKCFYSKDEPLSEAVLKRLDEEFDNGLVLEYSFTKTQ